MHHDFAHAPPPHPVPAAPRRQVCPSPHAKEQQLLASLNSDRSASLTLAVYFRPQADALDDADAYRLQALAKHLRHHGKLHVRLIGRCDPNGTDEYNNVLAEQRALAVKHMLMLFGVEQGRIRHCGRGASDTVAGTSKHHTYKQYRRVEIVLTDGSATAVSL